VLTVPTTPGPQLLIKIVLTRAQGLQQWGVQKAACQVRDYYYYNSSADQIPAELIKAGGETLYSEIQRLICCIWNKEELPQQWKESIIVPIYKKGDKTDCNNYRGISLLSTAYKILFKFFWPG
jgi:hypothetical protein